MAKSITGDDDKATASELNHIHILHLKIVLAAMLQHYQRKLMVGSRVFRDIHLGIQCIIVAHHQIDFADFHIPEAGLHQAGADYTDQHARNGDPQPDSSVLFFHSYPPFKSLLPIGSLFFHKHSESAPVYKKQFLYCVHLPGTAELISDTNIT